MKKKEKTNDLGNKIKFAVKNSGLTGKEVARQMGFSFTNLNKLYTADDAKLSTLIKLAKVTSRPLNFFLHIEESDQLQELHRQLKEQEQRYKLLQLSLKNLQNSVFRVFDMLSKVEGSTDRRNMLTLIRPKDTKGISYSHLLKLLYKLFTLDIEVDSDAKEIVQVMNSLINIVEVRQMVLHPSDASFILPAEITDFLKQNILLEKVPNEYIDFEKIVIRQDAK